MNDTERKAAVERLPHGAGFRFVTEVESLEPGWSATGVWRIRGDEWFLRDHFPGDPLVPGAMLAEALAQVSGIAAFGGSGANGDGAGRTHERARLAGVDLKFLRGVRPPVDLVLRATLLRRLGGLWMFSVCAEVGAAAVVAGTLTLAAGGEDAPNGGRGT